MNSRLLRFLLVGMANTAVGLGTIYLLKWVFTVSDVRANLAGYVLGLCLSFALNRNWTFQHKGSVAAASLRFLCVFAVAYCVNVAVLLLLRDGFGVNSYLCHLLSMVPYTIVFFVGSKLIAFPTAAESPASAPTTPLVSARSRR